MDWTQQLAVLALCDLPVTAQNILAEHRDSELRASLASSGTTCDAVIARLENDVATAVRNQTLSRTHNVNLLRKALTSEWTEESAVFAARNPLTPKQMLTNALDSIYPDVMLTAYCNKSTPENLRRRLTPQKADHLMNYRGMAKYKNNLHVRAIRAFALAVANPWMGQNPLQWSTIIQQAIAHAGLGAGNLNLETLLQTGSTEALVGAAAKPELSLKDAARIIKQDTVHSHTIGELVNRFGYGSLFAETDGCDMWRTGKFASAIWIASAVRYAYTARLETNPYKDAIGATKLLGNNRENWKAFFRLTEDWYGTWTQAAQATCKL